MKGHKHTNGIKNESLTALLESSENPMAIQAEDARRQNIRKQPRKVGAARAQERVKYFNTVIKGLTEKVENCTDAKNNWLDNIRLMRLEKSEVEETIRDLRAELKDAANDNADYQAAKTKCNALNTKIAAIEYDIRILNDFIKATKEILKIYKLDKKNALSDFTTYYKTRYALYWTNYQLMLGTDLSFSIWVILQSGKTADDFADMLHLPRLPAAEAERITIPPAIDDAVFNLVVFAAGSETEDALLVDQEKYGYQHFLMGYVDELKALAKRACADPKGSAAAALKEIYEFSVIKIHNIIGASANIDGLDELTMNDGSAPFADMGPFKWFLYIPVLMLGDQYYTIVQGVAFRANSATTWQKAYRLFAEHLYQDREISRTLTVTIRSLAAIVLRAASFMTIASDAAKLAPDLLGFMASDAAKWTVFAAVILHTTQVRFPKTYNAAFKAKEEIKDIIYKKTVEKDLGYKLSVQEKNTYLPGLTLEENTLYVKVISDDTEIAYAVLDKNKNVANGVITTEELQEQLTEKGDKAAALIKQLTQDTSALNPLLPAILKITTSKGQTHPSHRQALMQNDEGLTALTPSRQAEITKRLLKAEADIYTAALIESDTIRFDSITTLGERAGRMVKNFLPSALGGATLGVLGYYYSEIGIKAVANLISDDPNLGVKAMETIAGAAYGMVGGALLGDFAFNRLKKRIHKFLKNHPSDLEYIHKWTRRTFALMQSVALASVAFGASQSDEAGIEIVRASIGIAAGVMGYAAYHDSQVQTQVEARILRHLKPFEFASALKDHGVLKQSKMNEIQAQPVEPEFWESLRESFTWAYLIAAVIVAISCADRVFGGVHSTEEPLENKVNMAVLLTCVTFLLAELSFNSYQVFIDQVLTSIEYHMENNLPWMRDKVLNNIIKRAMRFDMSEFDAAVVAAKDEQAARLDEHLITGEYDGAIDTSLPGVVATPAKRTSWCPSFNLFGGASAAEAPKTQPSFANYANEHAFDINNSRVTSIDDLVEVEVDDVAMDDLDEKETKTPYVRF